MKKILTVATTIALALTGLSVIAGTQGASAVNATSNLFALNVANQSSGSAPKNFFELGGKTYFTANTLSKAASLWRVDGDITKEPEFLFDPFEGAISGRIESLWGYDKFLFFWVQDTVNYSSMRPYVLNTLTKEVKMIQDAEGSGKMLSYEWPGQFTESNGTIYGFANGNRNWNADIYTFNPIDMTVTQITTTPVVPARTGGGDNLSSAWILNPSFYAVGNYLYITNEGSSWEDLRLYRYDLTNNTWSGALERDGKVMTGVRVSGNFTYNGEKGFIFSEPAVKAANWVPASQFESFFVKPDGTFKRLGTWTYPEAYAAFANLDENLYVFYNRGSQIAKIDPLTGEKTDVLSTMFPGLTTTPSFRSVREVGDKLVFSVNLLGTQQGQVLLYSWDGVGAAVRFTDVNPSLGEIDIHNSASNSNAGYTPELGGVGNYTIVVLKRDPAIGAEPYYVAPDGTVTLMKDLNKASDGSAPQTSCFISTPEGDWVSGNLPEGTVTNSSQSVIVSMKAEGAFLKYSVISAGSLNEPCGFSYVGEDVFFQAKDTNWENGIYKRSPAGTITKLTALPNIQGSEHALSYGGNYYWLSIYAHGYDLYKYDVANNIVTRLTGYEGSIIGQDGVGRMALVGSKLVLTAGRAYYDIDKVYVADLADSNFTLTDVTPAGESSETGFFPENLMVFNGRAIFYAGASNGTNDVFEVRTDTNEVVKLFDIDPDGSVGSARKMIQVGSKLYITYYSGGKNQLKRWSSGTMATTMPLEPGFKFDCMAPVGGDIIVQNGDNGQAFYYGNGFNMKRVDYDFSGNTNAFCYAGVASHGSYIALPEYPYDQAGVGFGREPGYIGPLTPIAVSRLGQPVTEAPAVPLSSGTPSEITPAAPGTPSTPVATPGAGKVTLDWTAPTTGGEVATYIVESTPAGAQCEISGTSAACGGLDDGVAYTFTVTATNAGGIAKSSVSNSAIAGPAAPAPGTPGKPTGVGIEGGIDLTWTAPTTGGPVDSYIVQSNPAGGTCVITGTTARCTGLNDFDAYTFTVLAMNDTDISSSDTSESILAGDPAYAPPGEMLPPVLTPLTNAIRVTVTPPTSGGNVSEYRIRLYDDSSGDDYECYATAPELSCVFTELNPDNEYYSIVRAYNDAGRSSWSDDSEYASPLLPAAPGVPGAPTIEAGIGKLTVTATAPTEGGEVVTYDVTLSPGGATCTITAPATSCEITGLESGVTYTATTVAKNDLGTSESSPASAEISTLSEVPGQPDAPVMVAGPGKVTVTVTAPTSGGSVASYLVTLSPGGKTCTVTAPATTCEITGLDSTVAYTSTVVARNADGESLASTASTSATPLLPVPGSPAAPTVVVGNAKATVTAAPSMTGGPATSLKVTATPGGAFCVITLPATSCEITGLTNKTSYTFSTVATNASGNSAASVQSAAAIPVDPNADVAPEEGDGGKAPKGVPSGGVKKFVATNDSSFQVAWDKKTGKLISRATGIYTGYIEAKITFTKAGKAHTCSAVFGVLKVMPQKTAAQKAAAMKSKTFTGKQFCIDKTKLNPATLAPKGGMTPTNFKKIKPMNKSATELRNEKAAATALKNFTGQVDIQVIRYRAWPTTMINVGAHDSKGGKIPALVRNTKVTLG
jgi:hypothetical protein